MKPINLITIVFLLCWIPFFHGQENLNVYKNNHSLTYERTIGLYQKLAEKHEAAVLLEMGKSDYGKPIHLFIIDPSKTFDPNKNDNKAVLLINNGIHPGEPCGIDASINFANNLLTDPNFNQKMSNTVIGIIPIYNVGGALNRGCCSRANQNGPEEYGFRGNAKNLDLNRDFIKMDSKNAAAFTTIFHFLDPDILVDTHTSNGADYQYTMTLLSTQLSKLNPKVSELISTKLLPVIHTEMSNKGYPICPYVNTMKTTPESGIYDYLETPRYCTGYAALFNTIGFTTETHMWKPFSERVQSTFEFLNTIQSYANVHSSEIIAVRKSAFEFQHNQDNFPISWKLDTAQFEMIEFLGYESEKYVSEVTGLETFKYNRNKPWKKNIKYYNKYQPVDSIKKPKYYIISQAWSQIIERLVINNIQMTKFKNDTSFVIDAYFIDDYETNSWPYEGHYLHKNIKVSQKKQLISFSKGDYLIPTDQPYVRFILETLEPHATDSYFSWNFFDEILQQKEYFSHYVFEEKAAKILLENAELKQAFELQKQHDEDFSKNHWDQLYWIYKHSDNYEPSHRRYPVFRIN